MEYAPDSLFIRKRPSHKPPHEVAIGDAIFKRDEFFGHVTRIGLKNRLGVVEVSNEDHSEIVMLGGHYHHQYVYPVASFAAGDGIWYHDWDDYSIAYVCLGMVNGVLAFTSLVPHNDTMYIFEPGVAPSFISDTMFSNLRIRKMDADDDLEFKVASLNKLKYEDWSKKLESL